MILKVIIIPLLFFAIIIITQEYTTPVTASTSQTLSSQTTTAMTTNNNQKTKTIYLIRHAESEENRRLSSLKNTLTGLTSFRKFTLPNKSDIKSSLELLNINDQIDSDVSHHGKQQITQLGQRLQKDEFIATNGIQLVAHSPLKRARQTSHGMLQTVTKSKTTSCTIQDSSSQGSIHPSISRVVELDLLEERTPKEWIPTYYKQYSSRIEMFEKWIGEQEEDVIAIVGHSQYFRSMLGLKSKFKNVDVWKICFDVGLMNERHGGGSGGLEGEAEGEAEEEKNKSDITDKGGVDDDDDDDREKEAMEKGIVNEVDGIRLEDLILPKGWSGLKHLYRYDPDYVE